MSKFCIILWKEGSSEFIESFESKATANHFAKQWNIEAETSKDASDDYYTVELIADYQ